MSIATESVTMGDGSLVDWTPRNRTETEERTYMSSERSVSHWIEGARGGDEAATQKLWERYYRKLVRLARKRLQLKNYRFRIAGEEDVALSAFKSFWKGLDRGRFPNLDDRDGLWRLLVVITARKASDYAVYENRQKRKVLGESSIPKGADGGIAEIVGNEPTPAFALQVAEEYEKLVTALGDETLRKIAVWKLEGYTNDEIAQALDVARRTVARKLALIRTRLQRRGARPGDHRD